MKEYSTIIQSIVTEKSSTQQAKGRYTFLVARDATKIDVKHAVKALYGADVATVRTLTGPKKTRILKGKYEWNKRPVHKKAIITIKGNKSIDPSKLGSVAEKSSEKKAKKTEEKAKK